ncbi:hypothetical protein ACLKA6_011654 [Drosophila palustris]
MDSNYNTMWHIYRHDQHTSVQFSLAVFIVEGLQQRHYRHYEHHYGAGNEAVTGLAWRGHVRAMNLAIVADHQQMPDVAKSLRLCQRSEPQSEPQPEPDCQ